jgi:ferredoxin-fold anticodon binding domain-containing protein
MRALSIGDVVKVVFEDDMLPETYVGIVKKLWPSKIIQRKNGQMEMIIDSVDRIYILPDEEAMLWKLENAQ